MADKEVITILIDNIKVKGEVLWHQSYDFQIKIISPFYNISGGGHIAHIVRKDMNYDGEQGVERMRRELNDIYALGVYLEQEMKGLKENWASYEEKISGLESEVMNEDEFRKIKIQARKRLRDGEIEQREYQQLLMQRRKETDSITAEHSNRLGIRFFMNIFQ